jgi:RNA polymerase sigma factor (sigma-70 family)
MVQSTPSLFNQLCDWLRNRHVAGAPDAELLQRVAETRDEEAFLGLMNRHGPMVWGVCRRIGDDFQVAEDVFQATFLLLIRNARTIRKPSALSAWLHGTAYRLAVQARRQARRRIVGECRAAHSLVTQPEDLSSRELFAMLDQELNRLPDSYREPLILCYFDGLTQDEAARRLGISAGSIKGRLERGRARLANRLRQRGVREPALLAAPIAVIAVPEIVTARTIESIQPGAAIPSAVSALMSASSPALASRATFAIVMLLASTFVGLGILVHTALQPGPAAPSKVETGWKVESESLPAGAVARLGTTRLRPGGRVEFLSFSPDGKQLFSWSENQSAPGRASIWDTATGKELRSTTIAGVRAQSCTWLANGRGAALMNVMWMKDGGTFLWDFASEKAKQPPSGVYDGPFSTRAILPLPDNEQESCYAISPDGKMVAVGHSGYEKHERAIDLREIDPGRRTKELKSIRRLGTHPENCDALRFTPDGQSLLSMTFQRENLGEIPKTMLIVIWNIAEGKERRRFSAPAPANPGDRASLALSNQYLALGMADKAGTLRLYDLNSAEERTIPTGHKSFRGGDYLSVSAVAFTPDGRTVFTGGADGQVRIWDVVSAKQQLATSGHMYPVESLAVSPDGRVIASSGQDGVIRLWNAATGADVCPQPGHAGGLSGVSLSSDGKTAITVGGDSTVRIWDLDTARERQVIKAKTVPINPSLSPDGKTIVSGGADFRMMIWDGITGEEIRPPKMPADAKARVAWFFDPQIVMTMREDGVDIWDWPSGSLLRAFELPASGNPYGIVAALSPDGKWLVTVAFKRTASSNDYGITDLWNATTGMYIRRLVQSPGLPRDAIFTSEGKLIIHGRGQLLAEDGKVKQEMTGDLNLIDPVQSKFIRAFAEPPDMPGETNRYIRKLVLAADGRSLYAGDSTGAVIVYEMATGKIRHTFSGHRGLINGMAITHHGKRLVTSCVDSSALVWDLSPAAVLPGKAQPPTVKELNKCWKDLASDDAAAAFRAMGVLCSAPLQAVRMFAGKLSPADSPDTNPDELQSLRAVEVLERIATDEAKSMLKKLAAGNQDSKLTREAKRSLERLSGR